MLDKLRRERRRGADGRPEARGLTFYQVMALASIVEREAVLDEERPLIAGVYQNRIDGIKGVTTRSSTPIRPSSTRSTRWTSTSSPFDDWQQYAFWTPPGVRAGRRRGARGPRRATRPTRRPGSSRGRSARPSLPSIDAALEPDTADKYIYFLAIPDGGGAHAFAKTQGRARRQPAEVRLHPVTAGSAGPGRLRRAADRGRSSRRWAEADRAARPARLGRLRARFADAGVDAYFGVRREHMRYLTGFTLGDGEEKVAGNSGQFLVDRRRGRRPGRLALHDPGAPRGARRPDRRGLPATCRAAGRTSLASVGRAAGRRRGRRSSRTPPGTRLAEAAPDVELVPVEGWVEADRAIKEPAELERVAAACAVADRALAALLPEIRPGVTEAELALRLEWLMRTGGAEALAFDVACLAGPEAALPHGAPGDRPVLDGPGPPVRLRGAGRRLPERHDADPVRRRADARDLEIYELVARAQAAAIDGARGGRRGAADRVERAAAERPGDRRASPAGVIDRGRPRRPLRPRDRATGSAWPRTSAVARAARAGRCRCPARPSSRSSPASTSRARRASGSRTWCCSTPRRDASSG